MPQFSFYTLLNFVMQIYLLCVFISLMRWGYKVLLAKYLIGRQLHATVELTSPDANLFCADIAKINRNIVKIADLSNFKESKLENVAIKASVSIKSIGHGNHRHARFYMDLRDDSGEITAVAYNDDEIYIKQLHIIEENKIYIFTKFSLENSNINHTSIQNENVIVLNCNSVVRLCGNAPKFEWSVTPLKYVHGQDHTKFFNIVGLCTGVTETEIVRGELRRQVTLVDESRTEVILNVWHQETSFFDELDLSFHPVLFVKDARIYKYRGCTSLRISRYLQLLEPDDPRAAKIRKALLRANLSTIRPDPSPDHAVARIVPNQHAFYPYCTPSNFTRKNRNYIKIADLSDSISELDNVTVIATVTMKSVKFLSNYFCFDLRDDSGEIVAVAKDDASVKFKSFIEKNRTYSFTDFSLDDNYRNTSILHEKVLYLNDESEVKLCGIAPNLEWPLSPLTVIVGRRKTEYIHAFGLCTRVTEPKSFKICGHVGVSRHVTLVDQFSRELILLVKDNEAGIFDALDLNTHPVFFVKDATVSDTKYEGKLVLHNFSFLELLESKDPRARRVTEVFLEQSSS